MKFSTQQAEEEVAVTNRKRPPGLKPGSFGRRLSGFKNPLPRTKVRGYTSEQSFLQPVKSGAGTEKQPARNNDC